jgi:predicted AAA+ superfamily ATPase
MITRVLYNDIKNSCFQGKVILLIGSRQVGKTTLLKKLHADFDVPSIWLNVDEADVMQMLSDADTSTKLRNLVGVNTKLVFVDEAQQIKDIGKKLKLMIDTFPEIQFVVTGSSSLDLKNTMAEPLTGRKKEYNLYPISTEELVNHTSVLEQKRLLETRLVFGSYPTVINNYGAEKEILKELVGSYLYKDILQLEGIRKSSVLEKLLQLIAFQVGSEVSYNELANSIGNIDVATVEKYLDLLEKAYVIFKLPALSRNLRNELKKGKKYYFYDNGVRNVIINNFNPINLRQDKGALWENFLMSERMKYIHYHKIFCSQYFWRTHDKAEIDYIEEREGKLFAYEFKWKQGKARFPKSFREGYPNHELSEVSTENYFNFVQDDL